MHARVLRCLLAAALLASALPSRAEAPNDGCELPSASADPLSDRAGILAQYEQLPHSCLRQIFAACSQASARGFLDFGSAAVCSFGYEALLRQQFGGSFRALMVWWQAQRSETLQ
jgi:hypothetical protein